MQIICNINFGIMDQDVYSWDGNKLTKIGITTIKTLATDLETYANLMNTKKILLRGLSPMLQPTQEVLESKGFILSKRKENKK